MGKRRNAARGTAFTAARTSASAAATTSTKQRIIEAYLRLIAKSARKKVTVSAVAKAAGCNRDTFYYYFSSIDGAAKCALDDLAPKPVPHIARLLMEGSNVAIPPQVRARMLLVAKIAREHPRLRRHVEETLKDLWLSEFAIDANSMTMDDEAVLEFMAAGTVGFICERLAGAESADEFDAAFSVIARTFGKSVLDYARERGLVA